MFRRSRPRPHGPTERVDFHVPEVLIALEDQLLERLAAHGCEVRPALPRWRLFAGDMHHRVVLSFDEAGVLIEARNIPRKGPQTEALSGDKLRRVNEAVEACLAEAIGARFVSAPPGEKVSIYLPLRPSEGETGS